MIRNEDDEVMGTDGCVVRDDEGGGLTEEAKKGACEVSDDEVGIRNDGGVVGEVKSRQGGVRGDDGVGGAGERGMNDGNVKNGEDEAVEIKDGVRDDAETNDEVRDDGVGDRVRSKVRNIVDKAVELKDDVRDEGETKVEVRDDEAGVGVRHEVKRSKDEADVEFNDKVRDDEVGT